MKPQNKKATSRHSGKKGKKAPRNAAAATSPVFQDRVARVEACLKQLALAPAPPTQKLFRQTEGGTLEQVGREADNAWAGVQRIMSLLNVEEKHNFYATAGTVNLSGAVFDLTSQIGQGVAGSQRTGDSLKFRKLRAKFRTYAGAVDSDLLVVIGRSKDGVPGVADVFQNVGSSLSHLSFPNDDTEKADHWLWHHCFVMAINTESRNGYKEVELKIDSDVLYTAGGTTVTSGSIWMAVISDVSTNLPTLQYSFDNTYVDN